MNRSRSPEVEVRRELVLAGPRPLRGTVQVPGDKSLSHRALLLAAVAEGRTTIRGLGTGADIARSRALIEGLGVRTKVRGGELRVSGGGWDALREPEQVVDCGNSGTTLRVGLGLLAGRPFHSVLGGDDSLGRRPMSRVVEPLRAMGATIDGREGGALAPLAVRGGGLVGTTHELTVASAQVKTALLLAGLQASGETAVTSPARSRDHTERMLAALDAPIEQQDETVRISASGLPAFEFDVPGDPSSAAFFVVAALVTPGSELTIEHVSLNPTRVAFLDVLRRMGASIETEPTGESLGEPFGVIRVTSSPLSGAVIEGEEVPLVIDEIPVLAVAAAFAEGITEVRDAEELAVKESNRIGAVEQELSQLGVEVEARRDGLVVQGGRPGANRFKSHGDHRVAMAMAVAANACAGESQILGWRAVEISYPDFDRDLARTTSES